MPDVMRPRSAAGRSSTKHRSRPRSSHRPHSSSRNRSQSPTKSKPINTIDPDFLYEVGTLGSGIKSLDMSSRKQKTVPVQQESYNQYSDRDRGTKKFVRLVKYTFEDNPKVYRKFVHILSQVQYTDVDKLDLIKRVITLFDGYPHLILGFNAFLPSDYSIEIQDHAVVIKVFESVSNISHIDTGHFRDYEANTMISTQSLVEESATDETMEYIQSVKEMYADDPMRYKRFKEILKEFHSKKVDEVETIHRIVSVFHKYPHLIVGFNAFLPSGYRILMSRDSYDVQYPGHNEGEVTIVNFKKKY